MSPANQGFLHSKVSFVLMMDKTEFRKVPTEARDVHSFHISHCFYYEVSNLFYFRPANPWQRKIWRVMNKNLEILQKIVRFYFSG